MDNVAKIVKKFTDNYFDTWYRIDEYGFKVTFEYRYADYDLKAIFTMNRKDVELLTDDQIELIVDQARQVYREDIKNLQPNGLPARGS